MDRETSEYVNEEYKKVITMEDWKERLIVEQKELKDKLIKLVEFINSEKFYELSPNNKQVLKNQKIVMELYLSVLNMRVFEDIDKIVVPDFEGILMHKGSTERSSAGCLIVGYNTVKGCVTNSQEAFE